MSPTLVGGFFITEKEAPKRCILGLEFAWQMFPSVPTQGAILMLIKFKILCV